MKYDVCIVGHGDFPDGVESAMQLLVGCQGDITRFNLNKETTHEQFHDDVKKYLAMHSNVIVFADMTGGAPYQITAEIILNSSAKNQYILSSVSMNVVLDIYLKNSMDQLTPDNIVETFEHVIAESNALTMITPSETNFEEGKIEEGYI
ncbi:PTS fructose transporter subunit IIA [Pediococcus acidilactici]|uniref:PTS sugar transporter subunit IIA domain-containing protein n=1 Tax=Pediococcus acidilactici TaxID=1254 RepID=UPI003A94DF66